jgi:protein TonB
MFETVVPQTFGRRSRRLFYETLPVSIGLHAAVAGALLANMVWHVAFPMQSPKLVRSYSLVSLPEPPPPPPPPAPPKAVQPVNPAPVVTHEDVAPTIIPDAVPVVPNEPPQVASAVTNGVEGGVEGGIPGGVSDGVAGGDVGGVKGGIIGGVGDGPPPPPPDVVIIQRDRPLPMYPLSQTYPQYPEKARLNNWEDSLVVRYVIGKDGRVKEVTVISHAGREMFELAAVRAIQHWRFRPMIRDGEKKEVIHELTVNFRLEAN